MESRLRSPSRGNQAAPKELTKIIVDDTPNIKLSKLKSVVRRMKRDGVDIIFID